MNEKQRSTIQAIEEQRRPLFRLTVLDEDGDVDSELLYHDFTEAVSLLNDYFDAPGHVIVFEVIE